MVLKREVKEEEKREKKKEREKDKLISEKYGLYKTDLAIHHFNICH